MLRVVRQGAVKARTAALLQARDLITTAPQGLREQITRPKDPPSAGEHLQTIAPHHH